MSDRPDRDLPRVFTPDTNIHRLVMTALLLGILAVFIMIGGMG